MNDSVQSIIELLHRVPVSNFYLKRVPLLTDLVPEKILTKTSKKFLQYKFKAMNRSENNSLDEYFKHNGGNESAF